MRHGDEQADFVDGIHSLHMIESAEVGLLEGIKFVIGRPLNLVDLSVAAFA
jgi:hypothetical protein